MCSVRNDLFYSGCTEEMLFDALKDSSHEEFVQTLLAKSDYQLFVEVMQNRSATALQEVFDDLVASKVPHK